MHPSSHRRAPTSYSGIVQLNFSNVMRVGDTIQVTISGQNLSGPGGGMISIGQGASMSVPGIITQDLGHSWLVKLSISVGGANTIQVPK